MRLVIATPLAVVVDHADVVTLTAEDASGRFGVLPHHADFLTVLAPSVVSWRCESGREGHCAVRGGIFTVARGTAVSIATREAVVSDDVVRLEQAVRAQQQHGAEEERVARVEAAMLHTKAIRRLVHLLQAPDKADWGGLP